MNVVSDEIYNIIQSLKEKMVIKINAIIENLSDENKNDLLDIQNFLSKVRNNEIYICDCIPRNDEPILTSCRLATLEDIYNDLNRDDLKNNEFCFETHTFFELESKMLYGINLKTNHHKYFTDIKIKQILNNEISYLNVAKIYCMPTNLFLSHDKFLKERKRLRKSYDDKIEKLERIMGMVILNETRV